MKLTKIGVAAVPVVAPANTFPVAPAIPWHDKTCAQDSPFLLVTGSVRRSDDIQDIASFVARGQAAGTFTQATSATCASGHATFKGYRIATTAQGVRVPTYEAIKAGATMRLREAVSICSGTSVDDPYVRTIPSPEIGIGRLFCCHPAAFRTQQLCHPKASLPRVEASWL